MDVESNAGAGELEEDLGDACFLGLRSGKWRRAPRRSGWRRAWRTSGARGRRRRWRRTSASGGRRRESVEVEADQRERRVEEGVSGVGSCASAATKGDSGTSLSIIALFLIRTRQLSISLRARPPPAQEARGMYAPNDNCIRSVAKSSASVGTGVHGEGRGDANGEGVQGAAAGREDETEEEVEEVTIGGGGGSGARAGMVNAQLRCTEARGGFGASSCSQAGAGMVIMAGAYRVADADAADLEVEDRMGRAGTEGEGKEAGARVMKPLVCEA
ncbi:hypothetical protein B0H14DRAFT_2607374 [Mycena olivaceomarginata]|nr:hypothetical protein B0H14DRAFT_2607374 [Mycena olivaceomarginata]